MAERLPDESRVTDWLAFARPDWAQTELGRLCHPVRTPNVGMREKRVLSLSYGRVVVKSAQKMRGLLPASFETYQVLRPGDIVVRPTDLQNDQKSLRVGQANDDGIITSAYISLRPTVGVSHRYLFHLLSAYDFMKVFYGFGSGLRQNLDFKHIRHIPTALPRLEEQQLMVRFLDNVELRVARAIQAKQGMAQLLRESRQSAVLGELLTATGSEPIFQGGHYLAPEQWRNVPLWAVARETKRTNRPDLELLSVFLDRGVIRYGEGGGQVHKPSLDLSGYQEVRPGDLVLNNQQAWRGSLGVSEHNGIVSPAYVVCSLATGINSEWANSYFRSPIMVDQFALASRGVGSIQRQLHGPSLRKVRVCLPSLEEQNAIALRIRSAVSGTDAALASIEEEVALLREYRTRLISDVITGKKDVRAEATGMKDIDPAQLASVFSGVASVDDNDLGEDDDAD